MSDLLQFGVGFAVLIVIFDRVTAFVLKVQARRQVRETLGDDHKTKSPELMLADALGELRTIHKLFEEHDRADRAAFGRLEAAIEKSEREVMDEIRELRQELRKTRENLEARVGSLETRVAVLESRSGR